jgi:GT2 family glycosyltransferase
VPAPPVSIVIPCFNRATLVGEAIESALAQGDCAEILVVDDGSSDSSWEVIGRFGDRVRAFRTENRGVSAARNFGLRQARGDFVRFLDSDDRIPAGAVAAHLEASRAMAQGEIAVGDAATIDFAGAPCGGPRYGYAAVAPPGRLAPATLAGTIMPPWLPLFPIRALVETGGFDEGLGLVEDHELALRLARAGWAFVRVPILVCEVRDHPLGRLSRDLGPDGHRRLRAAYETIWQRAEAGGVDAAQRRSLGRLIWKGGRSAARRGLRSESDRFFDLARTIAGRDAENASASFRLLYRLFGPYRAERVGARLKRLAGRLRNAPPATG